VIAEAAQLLGGVGLFLVGMRLMTDGLSHAAGGSLKQVLDAWTKSPARGLLTGFVLTALVQSSSAVTVAIIGFVNAGMLTLGQAVAVIFGSNVGTTMTGWVVAAVGLRFDVGAYALPLLGAGALLRVARRGRRSQGAGDAMVGFGLFFLGIDVLHEAFSHVGEGFDLAEWTRPGLGGMVAFVAIGFAMTVLTQSSSAALTITLTAATGGLIPLHSAAATVIGTNIGTTSTAVLATIGATPNARRVAAAHVLFNLTTASVAILLLGPLLALVGYLQREHLLELQVAALLAMFHTGFNVFGVLLLWPLFGRLVGFVGGLFRTAEEDEGRPRYLDRNLAGTPDLAMAAVARELRRTERQAHLLARRVLEPHRAGEESLVTDTHFAARRASLDALFAATADFVARVSSDRALPEELRDQPAAALRVVRHHDSIADCAAELAVLRDRDPGDDPPHVREAMAEFDTAVRELLDAAAREPWEAEAVQRAADFVEALYPSRKSLLLVSAAHGELPVQRLSDLLDRLRLLRRLAEQADKASRRLALLASRPGADAAGPGDGGIDGNGTA
jgi:phosphate:Na+ symporter